VGRNLATETKNPSNAERQEADKADKSKLRVLWAGVCLYVLIMVNAFRFAAQVPYQILILGALINIGVIVSLFVAINKVRKRMQERR
jgi:hypothetical protein